MLDKEVTKVGDEVKSVTMNYSNTISCIIISNGWSNIVIKPIINYLLVGTKGELFLNSTDTSGDENTSEFVADEVIKQINLVGRDNIIRVLTERAANCKGKSYSSRIFPHNLWALYSSLFASSIRRSVTN